MKDALRGFLALVTAADHGNGAEISQGAAVFLRPDAAGHVTGAMLAVNGGFLAV